MSGNWNSSQYPAHSASGGSWPHTGSQWSGQGSPFRPASNRPGSSSQNWRAPSRPELRPAQSAADLNNSWRPGHRLKKSWSNPDLSSTVTGSTPSMLGHTLTNQALNTLGSGGSSVRAPQPSVEAQEIIDSEDPTRIAALMILATVKDTELADEMRPLAEYVRSFSDDVFGMSVSQAREILASGGAKSSAGSSEQ